MPEKKWILFDLDGTLADTLGLLRTSFFSFGEHHGVALDEPDFQMCNGKTIEGIVEYVVQKNGSTPTSSDLDLYRRTLRDNYVGKLELSASARHSIEQLASDFRFGLVTSGERALLADAVAELSAPLEVVVFGDDVAAPKPAPDGYLRAVGLTGANPEDMVAVEDSPNGVAAAATAGLRVIGLGDASLLDAGADVVITNLEDLPAVLT